MPAAPEQLTAARLDEVEPLWAQLHAHHATLAMPPAMRTRPAALLHDGDRPLHQGESGAVGELDLCARLGAQPAFVIMALP
jgi:hypothetical protein